MSDTSLILADYYEQHHAESVFSRCAARQMIGIIEHRINQMDERIARVLRLNIMEQSPVSEIAEVLSIKYKTAENALYQGRKVAQPTKGLYIVNGRKVVIR